MRSVTSRAPWTGPVIWPTRPIIKFLQGGPPLSNKSACGLYVAVTRARVHLALSWAPARTPGAEFAIAVAGPIVTLVVIGLAAGTGIALSSAQHFWDLVRLESGVHATAGLVLSMTNYSLVAQEMLSCPGL